VGVSLTRYVDATRSDGANPQPCKGNLRFSRRSVAYRRRPDGDGVVARTAGERARLRRIRPEKTADKHGVVIVTNAVTI